VNSLLNGALRLGLAGLLTLRLTSGAFGADSPIDADLARKLAADMQANQDCSDARKDQRDADVVRFCTPIYEYELKTRASAKNRLPYDRKMHNADGVLSDESMIASDAVFACEHIFIVAISEARLGYRTQARRDLAFANDLIRQTKRSDLVEDSGSTVRQRYDTMKSVLARAASM
jgi:hypothetical protein